MTSHEQSRCTRCGADPGRVRCLADYAKACRSYGHVEAPAVGSASGGYVGIRLGAPKGGGRRAA